jgi:hypothetical protein
VLDTEALSDLVRMTPNAWHLAHETDAKLRQCEQFQTTVGFDVLLFRNGKSPTSLARATTTPASPPAPPPLPGRPRRAWSGWS